ncbi:MAG: hypothetical protein WDN49_08940 [Acetobacteraceae bacterium]
MSEFDFDVVSGPSIRPPPARPLRDPALDAAIGEGSAEAPAAPGEAFAALGGERR